MTSPRRATDLAHHIVEFEVYECGEYWRAVHCRDRALVIEHQDWRELEFQCIAARIAWSIRRAER